MNLQGHRAWTPLSRLSVVCRALVGTLAAAALSCATPPTHPLTPGAPLTPEAAELLRTQLAARTPASFKMLHQVVAAYQGQTYLMSGYMLGRKDGAFRVSATAAMGPKLFDVARVDGRWESRVYLQQLVGHLDPTNVGRAVERIYFLPATGPLRSESDSWVSRSKVTGDDEIDTVEEWLDWETLATHRKRYFKDGKQALQVDYSKLELVAGSWIARAILLTDSRGFSLELKVTEYDPGFPVTLASLKVEAP